MTWQPVDVVVLILSLVLVIWIGSVAALSYKEGGLSEDKVRTLVGVLTAIIAVISVYVGDRL